MDDGCGEILGRHPLRMIRLGHVGAIPGSVDGAGQDAVGRDTGLGAFQGKHFRQGDHGRFRGAVGGHSRPRPAHGSGPHVDDAAEACFLHDRQGVLAGQPGGDGIDPKHVGPVVQGGFFDFRPHREATRNVGEDINAAMLLVDCTESFTHGRLIGQVAGMSRGTWHVFQAFGIAVHGNDGGATFSETTDCSLTQYPSCSGDDGDAVGKGVHG